MPDGFVFLGEIFRVRILNRMHEARKVVARPQEEMEVVRHERVMVQSDAKFGFCFTKKQEELPIVCGLPKNDRLIVPPVKDMVCPFGIDDARRSGHRAARF
jgi:hypothetical protein